MSVHRLTTLFVGLAVLVSVPAPAHAALITFSNRAVFNSAAPGLSVETFEAGLVASGGLTVCNGPINSASASPCFAAGGLLPGVSYSASPGSSLVLLSAGFGPVGNASKVIGPNAFLDSFNLTFAAANAIGLDVFSGLLAGNVLLSVFSPANLLLGSFTVSAPLGGIFFGVISDDGLIGRINIASQTAQPGELVDNVAFGTRAVPEPASMVLLGIALGASIARRRRR